MTFAKLFDLYKNDVYRLAYSYTLNGQDAEDILQIVFIRFYRKMNNLNLSDEETKKYLFKIAVNESKRLLLTPWKKRNSSLDNMENIIKSKNDYKEGDDLIFILSELKSIYRFPLYLYFYEGYNIEEISKILNISESAVKIRLLRGKEKLKLKLEGGKK